MLVQDVRDLWQFSAILEFVSLFGEALRIPELDVETFEQQLAVDGEDGPYIREVRLALLKSLSSNRTINIDNMDEFIRRQYTYRRIEPNPLLRVERVWKELFDDDGDDAEMKDDDSDLGDVEEVEQQTIIAWLDLTVAARVAILHDLCEWHLQSDKFRERVGGTTELQAAQWRIPAIGQDANRQVYYLLSHGRLYRALQPATYYEKTSKKRKRSDADQQPRPIFRDDWTCVATTYEEWQAFIKEFSKTRNTDERQLLAYLKETALPYIEEVEEEKRAEAARRQAKEERAEAERVKEMMRLELMSTRKRSSRIQLIDERKEAERALAEQLMREQELEAQARKLARQEEAGQYITQPKTREARARDRELREAMMHMQGSKSGTQTPVETTTEVQTPTSEADSRPQTNGNHYTNQSGPVDSQEHHISNGHERDLHSSNGTSGAHDANTQINHEPAQDYKPEPESVKRDAKGDQSLHSDLQQVMSAQPVHASMPIEVSKQDVDWVNRKAEEMTRGSSVPMQHVEQEPSIAPAYPETISKMPSQPSQSIAQSQDKIAPALNATMQQSTAKVSARHGMQPSEPSLQQETRNTTANTARTQIPASEHAKEETSAPLQVSQADIDWVQHQANRMAGPQTVPQESTTETIQRTEQE